MKKLFAFLLLTVAVLLFAKLTFAQTASPSAVNLVFPIAQLGNCSSAADCKTYCDDPTHLDACIAYAKEKGSYKEGDLDTKKAAILADAKATLGCDSLDSCRTFCQQAENAAACSAFAKAHNLQGGSSKLDNSILQKAEQVLGCTSEDSCKTFCQQDANKNKCAAFAKVNHLRGGDETVGPGGCTSEDSCKQYCSDPTHFSVCSQFKREQEGTGSAHFTGPGGCSSEEACHSFCDRNPTFCHLNPAGHPAAMSATGEAHMENAARHVRNVQQIRPPEHPPVAGSSGESTPRPSENPEGENTVFPTISQSVQAATTQKPLWQWVLDAILPKW